MKPWKILMLVLISTNIIHIRAIYEKAGEKKRAVPFDCSIEDYPKLEPQLRALNEQGYGIFFGVNGCVRDDEAVAINAQFVESDSLSLEEQAENLRRFPLKPSLIARARKSLHAYWLLYEGGNISLFRPIQKALCKYFSGDPALVNESRYMRLPGFYHQKQDPVMVEVVEYNPECRYTQQELIDCLESLGVKVELEPSKTAQGISEDRLYVPKSIAPGLQNEEHLQMMLENCEFFAYCKENCATLAEPLWRSALSNLIRFDGGEDAAHELSKGYPGYSFTETQGKIEEIKDYGFGPIRCDTLREYGFDCPKHCGCAAPAALPWLLDDETWESRCQEPWYYQNEKGKLSLSTNLLVEAVKPLFPALYHGNAWYLYSGGVYRPRTEDYVKDLVGGMLHQGLRNTRDINEVTELWRLSVSVADDRELNNSEEYINIRTGIYEVKTGKLLTPTPHFKSTIQLPVDWYPERMPEAKCPRFLEFLSKSLRPEDIPVVQEMLGYCCTTSIKGEMAFILYGPGRSGKSSLLRVAEGLWGRDHCVSIPVQALADRFKPAQLQGRLVNLMTELPSRPIEDSSTFKALVSGEPLLVENKGQKPYQLHSFAKMVWSANSLPRNLSDRGAAASGFLRRLLIIEMPYTVPVDQVNPNLVSELLEEKTGIFLWAMEGLRRLIGRGWQFKPSANSLRLLNEYQKESDNVLLFLDECVEAEPPGKVEVTQLYKHYQDWCQIAGYRDVVAMRRFNKTVADMPCHPMKGQHPVTRRAIWQGIRYFPPETPHTLEEEVSLPISGDDSILGF